MRRFTILLVLSAGCSLVFDTDEHNGDAGLPDALGDVTLADVREAIPAGRLCATLATPYCEARAACCATAPESMAVCENTFIGNCADTLGTYVLDERVGYNEEAAQVALDRFETALATCDVDTTLELFAYELIAVLDGTVAAGGTCTPSASDVLPVVSCLDNVCLSNGLFGDWTCGPPRSDGEACFTYLECERRLRCDPRAFMCAAQVANGQSCVTSSDCQSLFCRRMTPGGDGTCASPGVECRCDQAQQEDVYCGDILELPELPTGMRDG